MNIRQIVNHHNIFVKFKTGSGWVKTRSLGQILEKPCVHSRGHNLIQSLRNFIRMLIIIISRSILKLGHVGLKLGRYVKPLKNFVYILKGTVLIQNS